MGKPTITQRLNSRFNAPYQFSFKDLLAIGFVAVFFYISFQALRSNDALDLVKTYVPVIMVVVGGYFGQEAVSSYFIGQNLKNMNGMYGYSGYGYGYTDPTANTTTQSTETVDNNQGE